MSDPDELHEPADPTQRPAMQFSVLAMLVLLTGASLVLALYFGIGRAFGLDNGEILELGLQQSAYMLPMVIVWSVGLTIAIRRRESEPRRAKLAMVAFGGLLFSQLVFGVFQMVLIHQLLNFGSSAASSLYTMSGILLSLVNAAGWILILFALFSRENNRQY